MKSSLLTNREHAGLQTREAVVETDVIPLLPSIGLGVPFPALGSVLGFRRPANIMRMELLVWPALFSLRSPGAGHMDIQTLSSVSQVPR